jgi:hypothetical protein
VTQAPQWFGVLAAKARDSKSVFPKPGQRQRSDNNCNVALMIKSAFPNDKFKAERKKNLCKRGDDMYRLPFISPVLGILSRYNTVHSNNYSLLGRIN